jgi:hypothetical protein
MQSAATGGLDVPDPNPQMPFAIVTAADEGRIDGDGDRRCDRVVESLGTTCLGAVIPTFVRCKGNCRVRTQSRLRDRSLTGVV